MPSFFEEYFARMARQQAQPDAYQLLMIERDMLRAVQAARMELDHITQLVEAHHKICDAVFSRHGAEFQAEVKAALSDGEGGK